MKELTIHERVEKLYTYLGELLIYPEQLTYESVLTETWKKKKKKNFTTCIVASS